MRHRDEQVATNEDEMSLDYYDSALPSVVVDFRDDEPHEKIAELGRKLGVTFLAASSQFDVDEIYKVDTTDPAKLLAELRANSDVEAADYDVTYSIPEDSFPFADDEALPAPAVDVNEKGFP